MILLLANAWWLCLGDVNTMLFHVQSSLTLMLMSRDNNNITFITSFLILMWLFQFIVIGERDLIYELLISTAIIIYYLPIRHFFLARRVPSLDGDIFLYENPLNQ